jgi:hypothetical protein
MTDEGIQVAKETTIPAIVLGEGLMLLINLFTEAHLRHAQGSWEVGLVVVGMVNLVFSPYFYKDHPSLACSDRWGQERWRNRDHMFSLQHSPQLLTAPSLFASPLHTFQHLIFFFVSH